jgi:putative membrane-bound dehydrogenase-like protein
MKFVRSKRSSRSIRGCTLCCLTCLFLPVQAAAQRDPRLSAPATSAVTTLPSVPPKTPAEEAASFQVQDGFRMELIAAEPLVTSPVAMAYDENGRAYVCEMRDYPYTDKANHKPNQVNPTDAPIGRVTLLEDRDGDGRFDHSVIFADGLSWPTGVACWKGGVLVAATPDIWYFRDTDGDGRADLRRQLFTGFTKLNVQAVINNLTWGLDNAIHGAGSSNGGQIRHAARPDDKAIVMSRHDFRLDPVAETFDDWGRRFLCNIRNPVQHVVLPARYLARNPALPVSAAIHDAAAFGDQLPVFRISPVEPWREVRARRWASERDTALPRSELIGGGVFTSTSGLTIYRGAAWPEKFHSAAILGEVANNVIHAQRLAADGATFRATPLFDQVEFVASTDIWFRPVNFVNAPDGTLHVVDMYRENIEHPWSIPDDIHAAVNLENGRDRGRLWRLVPAGFQPPRPPRLGSATTPELVKALENPNSWWRETAQRLLFERQDRSAVPALRALVLHGPSGQARLHGLWSLHGLQALTDDDVRAALIDSHAGVRENAVRLAEGRAALLPALLDRVHDGDARVRFQLAFTLGETSDPRALAALAALAERDAADPWTRTAVLSSVGKTSDQLLEQLVARAAATDLLRPLAQVIGARGQLPEMQRAVAALAASSATAAQREILAGMGDGLRRSGRSLRGAGFTGAAAMVVNELLAAAAKTAADPAQPSAARAPAIRLLAYDDFGAVQELLAGLLEVRQPQEVQLAAVTTLGGFTAPATAPLLLANWRAFTPAVREQVVSAMLGSRSRVLPLLQAIDRGEIPAHQVPYARRGLLLRSTDSAVRSLAEKWFADEPSGARTEVVASYQPALRIPGDAARGKIVFERACAACHRVGEIGKDLGPSLATVRAWSPAQVLVNIVDPNREVAPAYIGYNLETTDGRTVYGQIAEETAASVTVQRADGVAETILRNDIAAITSSGLSLMPGNLETVVNVEQMADLIEFILAAR